MWTPYGNPIIVAGGAVSSVAVPVDPNARAHLLRYNIVHAQATNNRDFRWRPNSSVETSNMDGQFRRDLFSETRTGLVMGWARQNPVRGWIVILSAKNPRGSSVARPRSFWGQGFFGGGISPYDPQHIDCYGTWWETVSALNNVYVCSTGAASNTLQNAIGNGSSFEVLKLSA